MRSTLQLDTLFTFGALLDDRDGDGLPDALRARIVLGSRAQRPEHLAAVDLAARLGFASLALELPLVCSDRDPLPASIIPLFVGRPTTVAPTCPARLSGLLAGLQQSLGPVLSRRAWSIPRRYTRRSASTPSAPRCSSLKPRARARWENARSSAMRSRASE
jgi:hypothetical protein